MSRLSSWLRAPTVKPSGFAPKESLGLLDESQHLEDAMAAAALIMNDDVDGAEARLSLYDSAFHQLGRGVTKFMRSVLGWEQEIMKEAAARLSECENTAWVDLKRAQKEAHVYHSSIYPAGSEFSLVMAEAQLMSAVVGVLNESLTESIKGFYKLRKAYIILDGIVEAEQRYLRQKNGLNSNNKIPSSRVDDKLIQKGPETPEDSRPPTRNVSNAKINNEGMNGRLSVDVAASRPPLEKDGDFEFVDAEKIHSDAQTPATYPVHMERAEVLQQGIGNPALNNGRETPDNSEPDAPESSQTLRKTTSLDHGPDPDIFKNPIDIFVHSGTNLCLGIILLLLSMIPPAFGKLLYVVGFKGDRERGIRMLWQSTKFPNVNGAIAGLALFGYYNGLLGFSDIILTDNDTKGENITGFPEAKCRALLKEMRTRYPDSHLWRLEEARIESGNRQIKSAIEILAHNDNSHMKQISAMNMFERSLNAMYVHNYAMCAQGFLKCVDLNNWSHALYYFIAGISYVELYRDTRSDPDAAKIHKEKALQYLRTSPAHSGKKRFMAKQSPFDLYVVRKIQKWEERAKEWGVDMVDAIGVSPVEEMIYLWNGFKRMNTSELESSLSRLDWSWATHPEKHTSNLDETAVHALIKSAIFRNLKRFDESRQLLKTEILSHDRSAFKGHLRDDWSCPSAHYEIAVISWFEKDSAGVDRVSKIAEADDYLQKAAKWESYVMDSRIGLKITTALDTLKTYKQQMEP